jgi:hypothetical protein
MPLSDRRDLARHRLTGQDNSKKRRSCGWMTGSAARPVTMKAAASAQRKAPTTSGG